MFLSYFAVVYRYADKFIKIPVDSYSNAAIAVLDYCLICSLGDLIADLFSRRNRIQGCQGRFDCGGVSVHNVLVPEKLSSDYSLYSFFYGLKISVIFLLKRFGLLDRGVYGAVICL